MRGLGVWPGQQPPDEARSQHTKGETRGEAKVAQWSGSHSEESVPWEGRATEGPEGPGSGVTAVTTAAALEDSSGGLCGKAERRTWSRKGVLSWEQEPPARRNMGGFGAQRGVWLPQVKHCTSQGQTDIRATWQELRKGRSPGEALASRDSTGKSSVQSSSPESREKGETEPPVDICSDDITCPERGNSYRPAPSYCISPTRSE